jgi:hypothetical protein
MAKSVALVPVRLNGGVAKVTVELPELVREIGTGDELWPTIVEGNDWVPVTEITSVGAMPTPESATFRGGFGSLLETMSDAERFPLAEGLKVTVTEQFAATARVAPQVVLVIVKSLEFVPLSEVPDKLAGPVPVFEIAIELPALVWPTIVLGNGTAPLLDRLGVPTTTVKPLVSVRISPPVETVTLRAPRAAEGLMLNVAVK